jgi:hypothetical protein
MHNNCMSNERTERLHVLLSSEEDAMLKALAAHQGLNVSDYLRQQIRDNWGRCVRCGAEMRPRVRVEPRKPWSVTPGGLNACADCAPYVCSPPA